MSTLHLGSVNRRNFGDLLSPDGIARLELERVQSSSDLTHREPGEHSALAVWTQDPREVPRLPELLICANETEADWAAWITTFGSRIRPFSAFSRLLSSRDLRKFLDEERPPKLGSFTWPAAGLVLGEVLAASGLPDRSLEDLPASAFASTLSYAIFRAAAVYTDFKSTKEVAGAWQLSREITRQKSRSLDSASIANICAAVLAEETRQSFLPRFESDQSQVSRALRELMHNPDFAPEALRQIPTFEDVESHMRGSREERVVAINAFVDAVNVAQSADEGLISLALGYLVSRVAPGTIQHATLLARAARRYISSYLWYGFCAGLAPSAEGVLSPISHRPNLDLPASARRVARDLLRHEPILGPPTSDIGILELVALSRTGADPLNGLVTSTQGTVTIELLPAVATTVNVSGRAGVDTNPRSLREREAIARMGEYIDRIQDLYRIALEGDPPDDEPAQRSLFQSKRRKR